MVKCSSRDFLRSTAETSKGRIVASEMGQVWLAWLYRLDDLNSISGKCNRPLRDTCRRIPPMR
jgi:hypothetical protein